MLCIKTIKNYKNGCVILYGYQKNLSAEEIDPQFYLNNLIKFLDLGKENIKLTSFIVQYSIRVEIIILY